MVFFYKIFTIISISLISTIMKKQIGVQGELFPELGTVETKPQPKKRAPNALRKLQDENKSLLEKIAEMQKKDGANLQKIAEMQEEIERLKKKAEAFDDLMQSHSLFPIGVIAKNYGMSAIALNQYLQTKGVQFNRGDVWTLYAKYQNCGYTRYCWYNYSEDEKGRPLSRAHMYWTAKGMNFIRDLLIADGKIQD